MPQDPPKPSAPAPAAQPPAPSDKPAALPVRPAPADPKVSKQPAPASAPVTTPSRPPRSSANRQIPAGAIILTILAMLALSAVAIMIYLTTNK